MAYNKRQALERRYEADNVKPYNAGWYDRETVDNYIDNGANDSSVISNPEFTQRREIQREQASIERRRSRVLDVATGYINNVNSYLKSGNRNENTRSALVKQSNDISNYLKQYSNDLDEGTLKEITAAINQTKSYLEPTISRTSNTFKGYGNVSDMLNSRAAMGTLQDAAVKGYAKTVLDNAQNKPAPGTPITDINRTMNFIGAKNDYNEKLYDQIWNQPAQSTYDDLRNSEAFKSNSQYHSTKRFEDTENPNYGDIYYHGYSETQPVDYDELERQALSNMFKTKTDEEAKQSKIESNKTYYDVIYNAINGDKTAADTLTYMEHDQWGGDQQFNGWQYMNAPEKEMYTYLYNTEGYQKAADYYDQITPQLNKRYTMAQNESYEEWAKESPAAASAFSTIISPTKMVALANILADYADDREIDPNDPNNRFSNIPTAIRNEVTNSIDGQAGKFAYQTGMSIADNLYQMALTGGFGASGTSLAGISEAALLTIMGSGAAADSVIQARNEGISSDRAMILGAVAGGVEVLTEKIGLDNFFNSAFAGKTAWKELVKQMASEGAEEGLSDVLNWVADDVYDLVTGESESEWKRRIRQYLAEHPRATEGEAFGRILAERAKELGTDVAGGALSGAALGGGAMTINNVPNVAGDLVSSGRAYLDLSAEDAINESALRDSIINTGLNFDKDSKAYQNALKLQDRINNHQDVSTASVARQNSLNRSEQRTVPGKAADYYVDNIIDDNGEVADRETLEALIDTGLTEGNSKQTVKAAEALQQKLENGETITKKEVNELYELNQADYANIVEAEEETETPAESLRTPSNLAELLERQQTNEGLKNLKNTLGSEGQRLFDNAINEAMQNRADMAQAYREVTNVYNAGAGVTNTYTATHLTADTTQALYKAGIADRETYAAKESTNRLVKNMGAGVATTPALTQAIEDGRVSQKTRNILDSLGKKLGTRFEVYNSSAEYNGQYDPNASTIRLYLDSTLLKSADTDAIIRATAGHEITHRLQSLSSKHYESLVKTVADTMGSGFSNAVNEYKAKAPNLSNAQAQDEVIADFVGRKIFTDDAFLDRLVNNIATSDTTVAEKKSALQSLKDFFHKIASWIKDNNVSDVPVDKIREIEDKIDSIIKAGVENLKNANEVETSDNAETKNSTKDSDGNTLTEAQIEFFKDSKVRDEEGNLLVVYHGTGRADRVGTVFRADRATSGPMAFFTDNKAIADNYARDKRDTSISYDSRYDNYYTQFRVTRDGKDISVPELWRTLSASEKNRIKETAKHITFDEDYENIIYDENAEHGLGNWDAYLLNSHKGNALEALVEAWLEDGDLYNQENRFLEVLEKVGITDAEYLDPEYRDEKTYENYLNITKPFDATEAVTPKFVEDYLKWYSAQDKSKYETAIGINADMWDKRNVSANQFAERMNNDIKNGTSFAWTSIPDSVTDYLKELGYDGIKDAGGKNGGEGHNVWIPFYSEQIKNIDNKNPTTNPDIRYSVKDTEYLKLAENPEANREQLQRMVKEAAAAIGYTVEGYHGTQQFGFTKIDTSKSDDRMSFFVTNDIRTARTYSTEDNTREIKQGEMSQEELWDREDTASETLGDAAIDFASRLSEYVGIQGWADIDQIEDELANIAKENAGETESADIDAAELLDKYLIEAYWTANDGYDGFDEWMDSEESSSIHTAFANACAACVEYARVLGGDMSGGNYHVYINPSGLLEVDGNGSQWNRISFMPEELKNLKTQMDAIEKEHKKNGGGAITNNEEWVKLSNQFDDLADEIYNKYLMNPRNYSTTRGIARYAVDNGYTGVLFRNIIDDGGRGVKRAPVSDVYALFNPQAQIKSADPVTYDNDGNVIPLSERFNESNNDIRYSTKDSDGKELTPAQQEYFKDSKVRDEDGNLMVMYHGTRADFTVFDPNVKPVNGRLLGDGFYFTDSRKTAIAWTKGYGKAIKAYLNMTNPFVVSDTMPVPQELIDAVDNSPLSKKDFTVYKGAPSILEKAKTSTALFQTFASNVFEESSTEVLKGFGYDGIIMRASENSDFNKISGDQWVVFDSNQIKKTTNKKPTDNPDIRYSLKPVEPVEPTSNKWKPGAPFSEIKAEFPGLWDTESDESETKNPTSVKITEKSYRKYFDYLRDKGFTGRILDASSGLGYGTEVGRNEYGFDIEDIEPYPQPGGHQPSLGMDYSAVNDTFDFIISNAVLNVLPQDQRDALVLKMGEMLNPGGQMVINVRTPADISAAKSKVAIPNDTTAWYISSTGSYQKGFTFDELKAYLLDALGEGYSVEKTKFGGGVTVLVNKDNVRASRKGSPQIDYDTAIQLQETNKQLQEEVERLRTEFKRKPIDVKDFSSRITRTIRSYEGTVDSQEIIDSLLPDARKFMLNPNKENEAKLYGKIQDAAHKIITTALTRDEFSEAAQVREFLKGRRIKVSPKTRSDFGDWMRDYHQKYFGNLYFTNDKGTSVEDTYSELQQMFGEGMFPAYHTNPSDQLEHILEVYEAVDSYYNPYDGQTAEAIESLSMELVADVMDTKVKYTYADKMHDRIAKLRAEKNQKYEDLKAHYREVAENARNRRDERETRRRLLNVAQRLERIKTTAANRALIESLIGDLDTISMGMTGQGFENLQNLSRWYDSIMEDPDFVRDPNIEEKIKRLGKRHINGITRNIGNYATLAEAKLAQKNYDGDGTTNIRKTPDGYILTAHEDVMSIEDVRDLLDVLLNVENEIQTAKHLIDTEDRRDTFEMAQQIVEDIRQSAGVKDVTAMFDRYIVQGTLSPERAIHRYTGYVENDPLYLATKNLSSGQRNMLDYQYRANKKFLKFTEDGKFMDEITGKKAKALKYKMTNIQGNEVEVAITPAMRISLYLHSLNPQNLRHIVVGGLTVPTWKDYTKGKLTTAYATGTVVRLTPSEIRSITSQMTTKEMALAREVYNYFNGMSQDAINAVSEKLKGYALARVSDYFPINTDDNFLHKEFGKLMENGTIQGMGFLQERNKNAVNPVRLRDVTDVLKQSIDMTSKYVGLAIPVSNINKLLNAQAGIWDKETETWKVETAVKKELSTKWKDKSIDYIEKLIGDLQNPINTQEDLDKVLSKVRSNYAGAVLTLNLSVAMKQAASYPTAAAVVGWKPLAKAMTQFGSVDLDLIARYTPLQWYRTQGYSTQELGDIKSRGKLNLPKALNWIQAVDLATTRKLWKAAEIYVQENNKALSVGTDEYYKTVAEIYNQIIEETQPNYTTMQRPEMLRSNSPMIQAISMFKTQPFQNFNITFDAVANYLAKKTADKNLNTEQSHAEFLKAQKRLSWAVTSQVAQLFTFAAMTLLWNALRGKWKKYKDKDGNLNAGTVTTGVAKDMASSLFSEVPFGAEAWGFISSKLFGDTYYGFDSVSVSALNDMVSAFSKAGTAISDFVGKDDEDEKDEKKRDVNSLRLSLDSAAKAITKVFGVPYENVENLFNIGFMNIAERLAPAFGGNKYEGHLAYLKLTVDPNKTKSDYYDNLIAAYESGNKDSYQNVYDEMVNMDAFGEEKVQKKMDEYLKEKYNLKVKPSKYEGVEPETLQKISEALVKADANNADETKRNESFDQNEIYNALMSLALDKQTAEKVWANEYGGNTTWDEYVAKQQATAEAADARNKALDKVGLTAEDFETYISSMDSVTQPNAYAVLEDSNYTTSQKRTLWEYSKAEPWGTTYDEYVKSQQKKSQKKAQPKKEEKKEEPKEEPKNEGYVSVGSSWISGLEYDNATGTLYVTTNSGRTYTHSCSYDTYQAFKNSDSPGSFYNSHFK